MANLSRIIALKLLNIVRLLLLFISGCLSWPKKQMSDTIRQLITILSVAFSCCIFISINLTISRYCNKHYWRGLNSNSYFNNIRIIIHTILAVTLYFIGLNILKLWYSPKMEKWFQKNMQNRQTYIMQKRCCSIMSLLFISNSILPRWFGDFRKVALLLSSVAFALFPACIMNCWFQCERDENGLIHKLFHFIDKSLIKNILIHMIDKYHSKLNNDVSIYYINIPFQDQIIKICTFYSWLLIDTSYNLLFRFITMFQAHFGTMCFWIFYHSFALLLGYLISTIGHVIIVFGMTKRFGIIIFGMLHPLFCLNNLLLYANQFDEDIYAETYLENIWLFYCKFIIFIRIGHVVMYVFLIKYLIKLHRRFEIKFEGFIDVEINVVMVYYTFNVWRIVLYDAVPVAYLMSLHRYITYIFTGLMLLYFVVVGYSLGCIFIAHLKIINDIIGITATPNGSSYAHKPIRIVKTYYVVTYLKQKATERRVQLIISMIGEYLHFPQPICVTIGQYLC
eukprot:306892_1